jgi:hypothetical protein
MTLAESTMKYPALMAYITDRNLLPKAEDWCRQLRKDEELARHGSLHGGLADVAQQMALAQADYAESRRLLGFDGFPYNSAMGTFLGLPLKDNGEPDHGYYMASGVMKHHALGVAQRRAADLIEQGGTVRFILARDKKTGEPIRFATFQGQGQIKVEGQTVALNNGKRKVTLSSNWSTETCIVGLVQHLETGEPYGG